MFTSENLTQDQIAGYTQNKQKAKEFSCLDSKHFQNQ